MENHDIYCSYILTYFNHNFLILSSSVNHQCLFTYGLNSPNPKTLQGLNAWKLQFQTKT